MSKFFVFILGFIFSFTIVNGQELSDDDYAKFLKKYRKDYKKALLADQRSPLQEKKMVKSMSFYEANNSFIVKCLFIRTPEEKPFQMPTLSGDTKPYLKYGELLFELPGKGTHRISVFQSLKALSIAKYKDHLFIPFKDLTNSVDTYEEGRYIDLKESDIEKGIVFLDFNKAYNPWCAYKGTFSCPIPPVENHLNVLISSGEKTYYTELSQ